MITGTYLPEINTDILPCAIVSITDDGNICFVNHYICELLGYSKAELLDKGIDHIFTISTRIFYQTHFYPLVKLHNKAEEVFFSLKAKDGIHVPVIAYANKVENVINCVFVPARQRRKYEDEILHAKKTAEAALEKNEILVDLKNRAELQWAESERQLALLRQFSEEYVDLNKIISHDLHEPIRKLMVHIDLLLGEKEISQEKLESSLRKMMQFSTRLRQLTMSLQQYVAIDVMKEPLANINLQELIRKAFDLSAKEEGDTLCELIMDEMPLIEGYPSLIERLFIEIIGNSFKFKSDERTLKIVVSSTEFGYNIYKEIKDKYRYIDFIRIEIEDNGSGFPEEYSEYVFGLFKRISLDKEGFGFGLALCKKIVERHKGSISARSSNGKTIFSVLLPLRQTDF